MWIPSSCGQVSLIVHPGGVNHISMVGSAWGTLSALGARLLPRWGCTNYADSVTLGSMRTAGLMVDDNVMRFM